MFAILGTTFGAGDGSTTFNIPDLRGRVIAGIDNMGGTDAGRLSISNFPGTSTGLESITLTSAQSGLVGHTHSNTVTNNLVNTSPMSANATHDHGGFTGDSPFYSATAAGGLGLTLIPPSNGVLGNAYVQNHTIATADLEHTHKVISDVTITNAAVANSNASASTNIMQPTMVLDYIIRAL